MPCRSTTAVRAARRCGRANGDAPVATSSNLRCPADRAKGCHFAGGGICSGAAVAADDSYAKQKMKGVPRRLGAADNALGSRNGKGARGWRDFSCNAKQGKPAIC